MLLDVFLLNCLDLELLLFSTHLQIKFVTHDVYIQTSFNFNVDVPKKPYVSVDVKHHFNLRPQRT